MTEKPLERAFLELAARSQTPTSEFYDELLPVIAGLATECGSPEKMLGLVQSLFRCAVMVSQASIHTPLDPLIRTNEDVRALVTAHWQAGVHLHKEFQSALAAAGKTDPSVQAVVQATKPEGDGAVHAVATSSPPPKEVVKTIPTDPSTPPTTENSEDVSQHEIARLNSLINSRGGGDA